MFCIPNHWAIEAKKAEEYKQTNQPNSLKHVNISKRNDAKYNVLYIWIVIPDDWLCVAQSLGQAL